MKKIFLLSVFMLISSTLSASPKKYLLSRPYVEEDSSSDDHMHPELPESHSYFAKMKLQTSNDDELEMDERKSSFWMSRAMNFVQQQINRVPIENRAKNVIMFLGDGLSHPTVAAARVLKGGEAEQLAFEKFPYTASSSTYCVDKQVADSACSATAYLSGVKANDATIGLSARATLGSCIDGSDRSMWTESIASWAFKEGMDAGLVTTTRVTHASPTGVYGHIAERDWEDDSIVQIDGCDPNSVDDIAEQLVRGSVGSRLKVVFGGGSRGFVPNNETVHGLPGRRRDGVNLIKEWQEADPERTYVDDRSKLMNLNPSSVKQVLGLFQHGHLDYNLETIRKNEQAIYPTLQEMTEKAVDILSQNDKGYFLFVEGGRIDHGHHDSYAKYALDETLEFSKTIEAIAQKVNLNETLLVVTADHSHVMTMAGYGVRGGDIFGFGGNGDDGLPYFTLSYANGKSFRQFRNPVGGRVDLRTMDRTPDDFQFPNTVPRESETHGGDDVGIWAVGAYAHLFSGVMEQNVIPHIMAYAACIGDGLKSCD